MQAAQLNCHLLQGSSLGFTLTGEKLSLEDTKIVSSLLDPKFSIHSKYQSYDINDVHRKISSVDFNALNINGHDSVSKRHLSAQQNQSEVTQQTMFL